MDYFGLSDGGKTDLNAHPHCDEKNRIALIHNGTINNAYELKKQLQEKGIVVVAVVVFFVIVVFVVFNVVVFLLLF